MGTTGGDARQQAFEVVDLRERGAHVVASAIVGDQERHRVVTGVDRLQRGEGACQPFREQACAGRALGAVDRAEQAAGDALVAAVPEQLQVAPAGRVDHQVVVVVQPPQPAHVAERLAGAAGIRRGVGIAQRCGGRTHQVVVVRADAEPVERGDAQAFREPAARVSGLPRIRGQAGDGRDRHGRAQGGEPFPGFVVAAQVLRQQQFGGRQACERQRQLLCIAGGLDGETTGAGIERGDADRSACRYRHGGKRDEVVGAGGVEGALIDQRAGGDHARQAAFHQAFRRFRILELIHDRDTFARGEQTRQVGAETVVRDARHRDRIVGVLVAAGQRDARVARQLLGVAHERFVEVAHAHQQHRIRMRRLGLQVLAHHRGVGR